MKDGGSRFATQITVEYTHIDRHGHVSHVALLDFMSQATMAHADSLGWDAASYQKLGGMFVVRRHEIDYRSMAFLHDVLSVETWVVAMEKARAERRHRIVRATDAAIIAEGVNFWAYVNSETGRPEKIPSVLIDSFLAKGSE
jgi:acyl-CoA thioester hydrolase